ncbi:hypothetical protein M0811_10620 [Anaeramoeba ignava]|uniref:PAS domain-containing protein n=1 Tax=Anaeramoeba ignava TaxID=1746090 RepID=A0A9Q0LDF8_ANAIG|nr:hypothetical protein M0811_10620 [Anaeramoeba ignava]
MGNSKSAKIIKRKETETYLKSIREAKEAMILISLEDHFCIEVNDSCAKLLGLTCREELVNKIVDPNFSAPFQPQLNKPLKEAIEEQTQRILKNTTANIDFYWLHKNTQNQDVWVHLYVTIIQLKGKICFQCVSIPILNPLENEIIETPLDQSLYLVNPQFIGKSESDSSPKEKDSLEEDESKSTTEFSDLESQAEQIISSPKKYQSAYNIFLILNDEFEMKLDYIINKIKFHIRIHQNPKLEKEIIDELNKIKLIFEKCDEINQNHISKLVDKLGIEREKHKARYNELECHFQKNIEKSKKRELEFNLVNSKLEKIQEIVTDPKIIEFLAQDLQEEKKI